MGRGGGHGDGGEPAPLENYYVWLAFCTLGLVSALTLYGIALEYATSGGRKLHEISFVFVTTSIYAVTAYICREIFQEKKTDISKYQMLTLSLTSTLSTVTSVRSLRYVIYPVQVLFKSCKPVPVMIFGVILGKKYPLRKYVNVAIITTGVALFMGGGSSSSKKDLASAETSTLLGGILLTLSLCFDGATGAYEDKLMAVHNVEPFDLMFNIQLGKSFLSFVTLVVTNSLGDFMDTINEGGFSLILLGLTGAIGQVFIFVTISKFGALNTALIGLVRKILSLVLSFVLYNHTMNAFQTLGLVLAISSMVANFVEKGGKKDGNKASANDEKEAIDGEKMGLLVHDDEDEGEDEDEEAGGGNKSKDPHIGEIEIKKIHKTGDLLGDMDDEIQVTVDRITPVKK
jgi:solute carrier family 35 (UDP-galactose transporter), member B1